MSVTAAIRKLLDRGFTIEQALAAAEAFEEQGPQPTARQARNKRYYDKHRRLKPSEQDVSDDQDALPPKKEIPPTPPKEKTTPNPLAPKGALGACDFFAEFWLAYPRREGSNPRKPARLAFDRLVAKGASPQAIIAGAKALAVEHPTPTRFVPQATTWLNQERFADQEPVLTGQEFCPSDWRPTPFLVNRYRRERQTDPPSAINGGKAGYMLPAEWVAVAKQGQTEDAARLEN